MWSRIIVWGAGLVLTLILLAACAPPVYICQAVAPGTLACIDSKTYEKAISK